jgi:hypothetical protein
MLAQPDPAHHPAHHHAPQPAHPAPHQAHRAHPALASAAEVQLLYDDARMGLSVKCDALGIKPCHIVEAGQQPLGRRGIGEPSPSAVALGALGLAS